MSRLADGLTVDQLYRILPHTVYAQAVGYQVRGETGIDLFRAASTLGLSIPAVVVLTLDLYNQPAYPVH